VPKPVEQSVVILCDDFPSVRKMAINTLKKLNFKKIEEMKDGTELVDFFNKNPENEVDVVLLDEEMPDMNGSLAVRELRSRGVEIPIVMHSGNALEHQQALFYLRKADGAITKPADKRKIMDSMGNFIEFNEEEEEKKKEEDEDEEKIGNESKDRETIIISSMLTNLPPIMLASSKSLLDCELMHDSGESFEIKDEL